MPRLFKAKTKVKPVAREPNGRPSRRKSDVRQRTELTETEMKSVCVAARMRHTGLAEIFVDGRPETGKPNVGTPQGLLRLQGYINDDQFLAAEWYLHRRNEYLQSVKAPGAQWQPHDQTVSSDPDAYVRWCDNAKAIWASVRDCLHRASVEARTPIMSAFDHVLERGSVELTHMYGDLRIGLNFLYREFMMLKYRRAS